MTPAALAGAVALFAASGALSAPPGPAEEKAAKPPLEVSGRVYARESFAPSGIRTGPRDPWTGRFSLESARIGATYRLEGVKLEVEAELEGRASVRDAFAELDVGRGKEVRVGQFKSPFSALMLESSWKLPTVGRGVIHDLLTDELQVGGRRPGAQVELKGKGFLRPRLEAGIWQGTGQDGEPRSDQTSEAMAETAGARVSARPGPVEIGISGAWRAAQPVTSMPFERFWVAGADLSVETDWRLRSWIEGGAGSSWADDDPLDGDHAVFGYGRAVAAWRLGGAEDGAPYVEAFGAAGSLDPDVDVRDDLVWETAAGINAGRWKRWRGQLQFQKGGHAAHAPVSLLEQRPDDWRAVLLQVGVSL